MDKELFTCRWSIGWYNFLSFKFNFWHIMIQIFLLMQFSLVYIILHLFFFKNQISDLHPFDLNMCLKVWSMSELTWFNSSKRQSCYKNSLGVTLFFFIICYSILFYQLSELVYFMIYDLKLEWKISISLKIQKG